ncbi:hypothetical protein QP816_12315 [Staphylococcus condimenti]|uniref:hypothetical protein n=1 Tax=Staphylococcus condimenti TaxID=70255 RepID=UPI0013EE86FB|nr:hypothetical protein [Staphylococcus condimenti]MDK8646346.1 hypothetical protein [Staphylococcus condimenti]
MEKYGWTITQVKEQPYFELLDLLNDDNEEEQPQQEEEKVYTGTDLRMLFGS